MVQKTKPEGRSPVGSGSASSRPTAASVAKRGRLAEGGRVTAVLGPTNTGKTHFAVERMLGHQTGMIGLPLRLLAREVYDKVVAQKGADAVALITGEEKIVPSTAAYFICTVESMPIGREVSCLAVDEIQLCADPERGHVFTDRLLHARGLEETLFLGAETMRPLIRQLVPGAVFVTRSRLSELAYVGAKKISRLPRRSAIVAFSAESVYGLAELVRRQRGGAAVVMGALSPRTRNAQVALYQSGDVDFMVATDAIGMGLNMDVDHVAFASLRKFDGMSMRPLRPHEIGQIAGRAGRYMNDGTFGPTGDVNDLEPDVIAQIESHRFEPVRVAQWRSRELDFSSLAALAESQEAPPPERGLTRARAASDLLEHKAMMAEDYVTERAGTKDDVAQIWDICQIPDFRNITPEEHVRLLIAVHRNLAENNGTLPDDWVAGQVARLDKPEGDIDTLSARLAHIRTWTFIANRVQWLTDAAQWQERTREVEDKLSDALHEGLTQRFIDRRTSVLMKRLHQKEDLICEVSAEGEVTVEGEYVGRLQGFLFIPDPRASGVDGKALRAAAQKALRAMVNARAEALAAVRDDAIELSDHGRLWWQGQPVAQLLAGADGFSPRVELLADDLLDPIRRDPAERRLREWLSGQLEKHLAPLMGLHRAISEKPAAQGNKTPEAEKPAEAAQETQSAEEAVKAETPDAEQVPAPEAASESGEASAAESEAEPETAAAEPAPTEASAPETPAEEKASPKDKAASTIASAPASAKSAASMAQSVGGEIRLEGLARGIAYRIVENFGVLDRRGVAGDIKALDQNQRGLLRRFGVRFGEFSIFLPALLKPAQARLLVILWGVHNNVFSGQAEAAPVPPAPGLCSVAAEPGLPSTFYSAAGFRVCGSRAVRTDMLERLGELIRKARTVQGAAPQAGKQAEKKSDAGRTPAKPEEKAEEKPEEKSAQAQASAAQEAATPAEEQKPAEQAAPESENADMPQTDEPAEKSETSAEPAASAPADSTGESKDDTAQEAAPAVAASADAPASEEMPAEKSEKEPEKEAPKKPAVPQGAFLASPDMMSLVGCSGEEFENILRALGYVPQTHRGEEGAEETTFWRLKPRGAQRGKPSHGRKPGFKARPGERQGEGQRDGAQAAADKPGGRPAKHKSHGPRREDGRSGKPHAKHGGRKDARHDRKHDHKKGSGKGGKSTTVYQDKGKRKAAYDPDSPFAALAALKLDQRT